jgi:hypothetical protein
VLSFTFDPPEKDRGRSRDGYGYGDGDEDAAKDLVDA